MKTWWDNGINFLTWGQASLFVLLLRDPGIANGNRDIFLWFGAVPLAAATGVWTVGRILPGNSEFRDRRLVLFTILGQIVLASTLVLTESWRSLVQIILLVVVLAILAFWLMRLQPRWFSARIWNATRYVLLLLIVANLALCMNGRRPLKSNSAHPVVLFGADGADWGIIDTLVAQGQLPHIQAALRMGCRTELSGAEPLFSPILWTTMASGRPAAQNGLAGHITDLNASLIRCRRVWDIAEQQGKTCGAMQYLGLWPLGPSPSAFAVPSIFEGGLNSRPPGYDFIGYLMQSLKSQRVTPGTLADFGLNCWLKGMRLSTATYAIRTAYSALTKPPLYRSQFLRYRFWVFLERLHVDLYCHLYRQTHPDLALYYFGTLDPVEHLYFRAYRPAGFRQVDAEEIRSLGGIIPDIYRETDRALERVQECAGATARFLMISDHGMRTTCELAHAGYSRIYNGRTPFCNWLGYREEEVEWIQGFDHLYLVPRSESGITYRQIVETARQARLTGTGAPLWSVGFRDGEGKYWPDPPTDDTPGFVEITFQVPDSCSDSTAVSLPIGYRKLADLAALPDEILIQGAHYQKGIFLAWGPGIRAAERIAPLNQLDIMPTLLALMGLPGAQDLPGAMADILTRQEQVCVPAKIETYEHPRWKPLCLPEIQERDRVRQALREQMRTRGYLN